MSEQMPKCVCSRTPYPAGLSAVAMDRAGHACEECGRSGSGVALDIHYTWTHPLDCVEENEVTVLYRDCHEGAHVDINGYFWDDATEMESYWDGYYNEMEKG